MKFIRVHGRVIPIRDKSGSAGARVKNAAVGTASVAAGAATVYGLSRAAANVGQTATRIGKVSKKNATKAGKIADRVHSRLKKSGGVISSGTKKLANTAKHLDARAAGLAKASGKIGLVKTTLKRSAFVGGGLLAGHGFLKLHQAVSGKNEDELSAVGSHAVGLSMSAIASQAFSKPSHVSKVHKILRMIK